MTGSGGSFWQRLFGHREPEPPESPPEKLAPTEPAHGPGERKKGKREERSARPKRAHPEILTTINIHSFLKEHPRVVVDVWAPWCVPCRQVSPVVEYLAGEMAPDVYFGKINADHEQSLVRKWEVRSIPTLLFFRDGELVKREVGVQSVDQLRRRIQRTLRS